MYLNGLSFLPLSLRVCLLWEAMTQGSHVPFLILVPSSPWLDRSICSLYLLNISWIFPFLSLQSYSHSGSPTSIFESGLLPKSLVFIFSPYYSCVLIHLQTLENREEENKSSVISLFWNNLCLHLEITLPVFSFKKMESWTVIFKNTNLCHPVLYVK